MPWKASSVMEERLRFVARLLDGEAMTDVCRDFGVSRKTGHKIFGRYKEHGLEALTDRSRRPVRYANQLAVLVEAAIVIASVSSDHRHGPNSSSNKSPNHASNTSSSASVIGTCLGQSSG